LPPLHPRRPWLGHAAAAAAAAGREDLLPGRGAGEA